MRFLVTNIPINSLANGIVTVPDGTPPEELQDAIRKALTEDGYTPLMNEGNLDVEVDRGILAGGWELEFAEWRF